VCLICVITETPKWGPMFQAGNEKKVNTVPYILVVILKKFIPRFRLVVTCNNQSHNIVIYFPDCSYKVLSNNLIRMT
jgi:hypothetical protein